MNKSFLMEIGVSAVLILLLILFLSPFDLLMPRSTETMVWILIAVFFFAFTTFIWKEKAHDERESMNINTTGRVSFITGSLIAVLGILKQSLSHNIDPWLIFTVTGMILAKILYHVYSSHKK